MSEGEFHLYEIRQTGLRVYRVMAESPAVALRLVQLGIVRAQEPAWGFPEEPVEVVKEERKES